MASLFLLIAALVLSRGGVGPLVDPERFGAMGLLALVLAGTLGVALLALLPRLSPRWRPRPGAHAAWSRSARRTRWIGTISCAWLAFCLLALGWLGVVRAAVGDLVLLDEAIAMSPAFAAMTLAWWWHSAYAMPAAPVRERVAFVITQMRVQWPLFLAPIAIVLASQEIVERLVPEATAWGEWLSLGAAVAALLLSPAAVMPLLGTAPLPARAGLPESIRALLSARGVRVRGVRLWRTGGTLMNALALGVLPWCRWMLLSDALLANLSDDEALAVAGHEAGHMRQHHAAWLAGSIVGGVGCFGLAVQAVLDASRPILPASPWVEWAALALLIAASILFFGAVSRCCERQADAEAVRAMSPGDRVDPEAVASMRRALAVVAFANGIPPNRPSFRHGSIASRRRRLEAIVGLPKRRLPIDRVMTLVRGLIVAALAVTIASLFLPAPEVPDAGRIIRHLESAP